LPANEVSKLHRIQSDEVWHFYEGNELTIHIISPRGDYSTKVIGPAAFQAVVPANFWFGATVDGDCTLASCTVAPGFDFRDFEWGQRTDLLRQFPRNRPIIERLTP
jgi:predicted cupin superfamily sugar epimerase